MDDYVAILIYGPWLGSWILDFGRSSFAAPPGLDFGAWILDFVIFARALHKESRSKILTSHLKKFRWCKQP